ncbi:hypothetical protein HDU79_000052 [Rhizoclosmatium sp. JEL0117]|nr:hypothetical protein HDU99_004029 [Rhizoclosmatium hyalinum]KAJ3299093.1 hypothetical protein HDU79_000052 [Rhizoclosmatium sp. JEL0117]
MSEVLATRLCAAVPSEDIEQLRNHQYATVERLYATDAALKSFNTFSASRFEAASGRIEAHVTMLKTMKADLDVVFKRVRAIKAKLAKKYPEVYAEAVSKISASREEEEDDD